MSEERRKRQMSREPSPSNSAQRRKYLLWAGILILFAAAYYAGWYHSNHKYDKFAQCLAARHVTMYGLYYCPHCADQKAMFGGSFHYVPYVECAIKGPSSTELAPRCKMAGASLFPSWQFGVDPPSPGVLSLDALSEKTGCSLP
jgi:hypothetical protein